MADRVKVGVVLSLVDQLSGPATKALAKLRSDLGAAQGLARRSGLGVAPGGSGRSRGPATQLAEEERARRAQFQLEQQRLRQAERDARKADADRRRMVERQTRALSKAEEADAKARQRREDQATRDQAKLANQVARIHARGAASRLRDIERQKQAERRRHEAAIRGTRAEHALARQGSGRALREQERLRQLEKKRRQEELAFMRPGPRDRARRKPGARGSLARDFAIGSHAMIIGGGISQLGDSVGGVLNRAKGTFQDMEHAAAEVQTIIKDAQPERLEKIATSMAKAYGGLPVDQMKALYDIAGSGIEDLTKAQEFLASANTLAVGGGASIESSTLALSKANANFGSSAQQTADSLSMAVNKGYMRLEELAQAMPRVASNASAMGLTMDQTNGILAFSSLKMANVSEGATALRGALTNIAKPSKMAREEAKKLGIQFSAKAFEEMGVEKFVAQFKGLDAAQLGKLFESSEARSLILAMIQDTDKLAEVIHDVEKGEGAAQRAFEKMSKTAAQRERILQATQETMWLEIGKQMQPVMADLLPVLTESIGAIGEIVRQNPVFVSGLVKGAIALKGLAMVGGPMLQTFGVLKSMTGLTRGLVGMASGGAAATKGLLAMLGPLGLVAAGIAAAVKIVMVFRSKIDELKETTRELSGDIEANTGRTLASADDKQLEETKERLAKDLEREEAKLKAKQENQGFFEAAGDFVFGSGPQSDARDDIKKQLAAAEEELAARKDLGRLEHEYANRKPGKGKRFEREDEAMRREMASAYARTSESKLEGEISIRFDGLPPGVRAEVRKSPSDEGKINVTKSTTRGMS